MVVVENRLTNESVESASVLEPRHCTFSSKYLPHPRQPLAVVPPSAPLAKLLIALLAPLLVVVGQMVLVEKSLFCLVNLWGLVDTAALVGWPITLLFLLTWPMQPTLGDAGSSTDV